MPNFTTIKTLCLLVLLAGTVHGQKCLSDGDCGAFEKCQLGECEPLQGCFNDGNCAAFQACNNNVCEYQCFSGRSTVDVQGRGTITMDSLKVGDYVRVKDGAFSKVHGFGHFQPNVEAEFLKIQTTKNNAKAIEVTPEHMIYAHNKSTDKNEVVAAGNVMVGDFLVTENGPAEIVSINKIFTKGAYAPLTTTGDILVEGVLASNYVSRDWIIKSGWVKENTLHLLQHGTVTTQRLFCDWLNVCTKETYDPVTGFSPLVQFFHGLEQWQLQAGAVPRALFLASLVPLALAAIVIGQVHLAPLSTLMFALVGTFVWMQQCISKKKNGKSDMLVKKFGVE